MKVLSRRGRSGFTLVEVIAGLAIAMFLMGALFQAIVSQSKYQEIASRELAESQIARTLLHQIGDELRSLSTTKGPVAEPVRARARLSLGDVSTDESALSAPAPETPITEGPPPVEGAERFSLLGTSNRLLLTTYQSPPMAPLTEESQVASTTQASGSGEDTRRDRDRWGDARQVFYLLRPLPEVLERKEEPVAEIAEEGATDEEQFTPYYSGLIRQEVDLIFSTPAHEEAFFQLQGHLFPAEEESFEPEFIEPEAPATVTDEKPIPGRTHTRVITDRISAILFRYHDGTSWLTSWPFPDRLPVTVEVSLSFDSRAADPEFLKEYFETRAQQSTGEAGNESPLAPVPTAEGMEPEDPLFPYRLVTAIPSAQRLIPPPASQKPFGTLPPPLAPEVGP